MCIICNCGDTGDKFLDDFLSAQRALEKCKESAIACAKIDKRYDAMHKKLVKLAREFNRIEQEREI